MSHPQTTPTDKASFPFEDVPGNLFPPVCLRSHWDPTEMLRHILPQQKVNLPMDFRPLVRVCKEYKTSARPTVAPLPPASMVFPSGGEFYPPGRYAQSIDKESVLRTLNQPLDKWCNEQYIPSVKSDLYHAGSTVPDRRPVSSAFVQELSMPQALLRTDMYTCRSSNDAEYFERSNRLFNNPTKQDRYGADTFYALPNADHGRGDPMPHGGVGKVTPTVASQKGQGAFSQPGGSLPSERRVSTLGKPIPQRGGTSFVGIATHGLSAPVW